MATTTIELTDSQFSILHSLAKKNGKTENQLAAEVLSKYIDQNTEPARSEWLAAVKAAAGIWEDRDDLPEFFESLRKESDRYVNWSDDEPARSKWF